MLSRACAYEKKVLTLPQKLNIKSFFMKKIIGLVICTLVSTLSWASITVSGVVTSSDEHEPVIGASVLERGTSNGTITDVDGRYTITVGDKATLEISYIGYATAVVKVSGSQHNVVLQSEAEKLDEVVVTAMGVVQEKKRMNFAVQSVGADALIENHSANFVNALQGKVAGLSVTNGSGSPNAGSQIIIRGVSSVNTAQSNEPLFILDGMPISGGATAAADINPNDIENVTVLKGAAAAALYGQDAANGVIMITTKKGQAGKITVQANGSWQWDTPTRIPELQSTYGPGAQGFYKDKTTGGWGPMLNEGQQIYDNIGNFLTTGFYQKYDFSVTGGSEKFTAYASANWSKADGVIPNDYRTKFGGLVKASFTPAKWVTMNFSASVTDTKSRSTSGIGSAYSWAITDDITDYQLPNGFPRFLYYNESHKYNSTYSPLYAIYNDDGVNKALRNVLNGSVTFTPVKGLNITGRVSYDTKASSSDSYTVPRWDDSYVVQTVAKPKLPVEEGGDPAEWAAFEAYQNYMETEYLNNAVLTTSDIANMSRDKLGAYYTSNGRSQLFTAGANISYKAELPHDFSLDLMAGTEMKMSKGFSTSNQGFDFIIPGTYSLSNTNSSPEYLKLEDRTASHTEKRTFGYFGEVRADYKGLASLSVTGRWDWSSTINKNPYFYPSVTAGVVFSELIPGLNETKNNWFSYGKLRGNYAVVGKDAPLYAYDRYYKQFSNYPDGGYGIDPTHGSADQNLMPEMSYSWEIGLDLRFFNNRTRLDAAYYNTRTDNQIVLVRVSPTSGHILQYRNEGCVSNQGMELSLEQDVFKLKNFKWTLGLNVGLNRGRVESLPENVAEITGVQYGDVFTSAYMGGSTTGLTGKDYLRNKDGQVIVDANGYPKINPNKNEYIGNREAKFSAGLTSSMDIYGVQFSFLFDGRYGGDVLNVTGRNLISSGNAKILEKYRGRQVVFEGVTEHTDAAGNVYYEQNVVPITLDATTIINYFYQVSSNFVEDGSYIRLSYVTLGYDFAKLFPNKNICKSLKVNFTANNLFLLTKYTGSDPMCNASTSSGGTGSAGIDNTPTPNSRSYNLSVAVSF